MRMDADGDGRYRVARRTVAWLVVDGNRLVVAGVILLAVFVLTVLAGILVPIGQRAFVLSGTSADEVFPYLLTGIVSLVTITLSVNQLVLSYQIGSIEKQENALEQVLSYRDSIRELGDEPSLSRNPSTLLNELLDAVILKTDAVRETLQDDTDEQVRDDVAAYSDGLAEDVDKLQEALQSTRFGAIDFMEVLLSFDCPEKLRRLNALQHQYDTELSSATDEAMNGLAEALELFLALRSYFKISHLQSAFINFSQAIVYTGLPALLITFFASQFIGPETLSGTILGVDQLLIVTALLFAGAITPFVLFIVYISRIVALTWSTIFTGPIHPSEEDQLTP